jgi:anhydro-N-acetylmuramic acid kinase
MIEQKNNNTQSPCIFRAIGVMSGTSLDGLDLCFAEYTIKDRKWRFKIISAKTISYPNSISEALKSSMRIDANKFQLLHASYGKWIGEQINEFIEPSDRIDLIGSHGHTVFHNPQNGYTTQIGSGAHIAAETGIPCVCDFRSSDIARGGQGAPLVPIGDNLLFNEYDFCLNIGGIANLSYGIDDKRVAYDICAANMALNHIANKMSLEYDDNGKIGAKGQIIIPMLDELNQLDYYNQQGAKSLGREWFDENFLPIIIKNKELPEDILRTIYEHIAIQIVKSCSIKSNASILITGGGARNTFLVDLIRSKTINRVIVPDPLIVDFKEALIFGFLAVLYQLRIPSCLATVTGAKRDSVGGCMYF